MAVVTRVLVGDVRAMLATLPDNSVSMCVTSPPYWGLRAYGTEPQVWGGDGSCLDAHEWGDEGRKIDNNNGNGSEAAQLAFNKESRYSVVQSAFCRRCNAWRGELGSEPTPDLFIANLVAVFREVRRVLHPSGTLWLNIGDSYSSNPGAVSKPEGGSLNGSKLSGHRTWLQNRPEGIKPKDLLLMPYRLALALQADGWWVRSQIVWAKKSAMPESVTDRPTSAWEPIFLLSKSARYFYDAEAVREPQSEGNHGLKAARERGYRDPGERRKQLEPGHGVKANGSFHAATREVLLPAGRNMRNVWSLSSEPFADAHFATFPTEIPRRAILAGTSERGACPACGVPWRRTVERAGYDGAGRANGNVYTGQAYGSPQSAPRGPKSNFGEPTARTTGWQPGCTCAAGDPRPCVVLDCFAGAGTTGLVADRLGRDSVLIELSPTYAEMIRKRISGDAPLFAEVVG
jgi:DNA modification methylase